MYELTATIKLSKAIQHEHATADQTAMVSAMWQWSRMIDDIAAYGSHDTTAIHQVLTEQVYPRSLTDADGNTRPNPMELTMERQGTQVHYLDLAVTIGPYGVLRTELYNKRD